MLCRSRRLRRLVWPHRLVCPKLELSIREIGRLLLGPPKRLSKWAPGHETFSADYMDIAAGELSTERSLMSEPVESQNKADPAVNSRRKRSCEANSVDDNLNHPRKIYLLSDCPTIEQPYRSTTSEILSAGLSCKVWMQFSKPPGVKIAKRRPVSLDIFRQQCRDPLGTVILVPIGAWNNLSSMRIL
jgi:hypothetical protein